MMDPSALDHTSKFLFDLTSGGQDFGQYNCNLLGCPTPPDSVSSANTPSPSRFIYSPTPSVPQEDNFNCTPIMTSSPGPSSAAMVMPCRYPPSGSYQFSSSLPVGRAEVARRATRRPQLTSAHYNEASIKILNPKQEYYKVQKKHGPRGRYSEQRISNGQVEMQIETQLPLIINHLEVYVMREFEAAKKLTFKDPKYGVGPTRITQLDVAQVTGSKTTYICKFDLDSVYNDDKEVYRLEKTKGSEYNHFQLKVCLQLVNGASAVLYPYEFVLTTARTQKCR
ncbi:hypothetical protein OS493_038553 [Desmophyllum pertusum]|uniref:Uncharacterized protein n=1 Tax=Desmophyllum pertusum TaxID=174260 RepID=A0A9W9YU47_9CNID|nr:hypothetical protein OS493_038553 [Desmophyllum pertusum]